MPLDLAHLILEHQQHAHLTSEQILIVKEQELLQQLAQLDFAQMPLQQQILMLLVLPFKMDVLLQVLDAPHHWELAQDIKELPLHAYNMLEVTVTALLLQHKLHQVPVLPKYAQMPQQPIQQILHAKHFHSIVSQMVQDVFYRLHAKHQP